MAHIFPRIMAHITALPADAITSRLCTSVGGRAPAMPPYRQNGKLQRVATAQTDIYVQCGGTEGRGTEQMFDRPGGTPGCRRRSERRQPGPPRTPGGSHPGSCTGPRSCHPQSARRNAVSHRGAHDNRAATAIRSGLALKIPEGGRTLTVP
jgi:hypothetical protein